MSIEKMNRKEMIRALRACGTAGGTCSECPLIVVAEHFVESLKSMADETDLEAAEKLRERCAGVTIPTAFGRRTGGDKT